MFNEAIMSGGSGGTSEIEYSDYTIGVNGRFKIARIGKYRCIVGTTNSQYVETFRTFTLNEIDRPKTQFSASGLVRGSTGANLFTFNTNGTVTMSKTDDCAPPTCVWEAN